MEEDDYVGRYAGRYAPLNSLERQYRISYHLCFGCGENGHISINCLVPFPFDAPEAWRRKQQHTLLAMAKKEKDLASYGFDEHGKPYLNWHNGVYGQLTVNERQRRDVLKLCFNCAAADHGADYCPVPPPPSVKPPITPQVSTDKSCESTDGSDDSSQESSASESESDPESDEEESESSSESESEDEREEANEPVPLVPAQPAVKRPATSCETPKAKRARYETPVPPPQRSIISPIRSATKAQTPVPPPQRCAISPIRPRPALNSSLTMRPKTPVPPPQRRPISSTKPMSALTTLPTTKAETRILPPPKRPILATTAATAKTHTPILPPQHSNKPKTPSMSLPTRLKAKAPILPPPKQWKSCMQDKPLGAAVALAQPAKGSKAKKTASAYNKPGSRSTTAAVPPVSQPAKDEPLSQASAVPYNYNCAVPRQYAARHWLGRSIQDYVKNEPPPSQQPPANDGDDSEDDEDTEEDDEEDLDDDEDDDELRPAGPAIAVYRTTSLAEGSTKSARPSVHSSQTPSAPKSPTPIVKQHPPKAAAPQEDSHQQIPANQPVNGALSLSKKVMRQLKWSEKPLLALGRDSRPPPLRPDYLLSDVSADGQLQIPIHEGLDQLLQGANHSLMITVTNDPGNHHLRRFARELLHQIGGPGTWCFVRNKHIIATYSSIYWRAWAMRRLNGSAIVDGANGVQVNCNIYGLSNTSYDHTCFIIRDTTIFPSRAQLQQAILSKISDGDMTVDYGIWTDIELFNAVRVIEFVRTQNLVRMNTAVGILIVFPTKFEWQDCFAEMEIGGVQMKVELLEEETECGFCRRAGHQMRSCDHYERGYRKTINGEWVTEHLELNDVM